MSPRGNRFVVMGLLLILFGSGVAIGVVLERLWLGKGDAIAQKASDEERVERLLQRFKKDLALDAAQERQAKAILLRGRADVNAILSRIEPEVRASRQKTREEITKLLSAGQAVRYQEMVTRYRARRAAEEAKAKPPGALAPNR